MKLCSRLCNTGWTTEGIHLQEGETTGLITPDSYTTLQVLPLWIIWRKSKNTQLSCSPLCSEVQELEWCNRNGPPPTAAWRWSPCLWRTSVAPLLSASTVHTFPVKDRRIIMTTTVCATVFLSISTCCLKSTHWSLFNDSVEHDDSFGTLFPNHQPEMATGIPQRTLKNVNVKKIQQQNLPGIYMFLNTPHCLQPCTHLRKNVSSLGFFHRH